MAKVVHFIDRNQAACGFRWNSLIRKQYVDEIKKFKQERKKFKKANKKKQIAKDVEAPKPDIIEGKSLPQLEISLKDVISFLKGLEIQQLDTKSGLEEKCSALEADLAEVNKQKIELTRNLDQLKAEHKQFLEDYKALISIMNRLKTLPKLESIK